MERARLGRCLSGLCLLVSFLMCLATAGLSCSMWDLVPDQGLNQAPCIGSTESWPLDDQEVPDFWSHFSAFIAWQPQGRWTAYRTAKGFQQSSRKLYPQPCESHDITSTSINGCMTYNQPALIHGKWSPHLFSNWRIVDLQCC